MKKKKDEAAAGFRETLQSTLRAYKIWNRYAPKLLTSTALYSIFSALSPYVPVYFSAPVSYTHLDVYKRQWQPCS